MKPGVRPGDFNPKLYKYLRTGCPELYPMVLIGFQEKIETRIIT